MNPRFGAATTSGDSFFSASIGTVTIRGQFGPWAIETGGAGQYVNLALPLNIGSLGGPQPIDFTNVTVHVEAVLRFTPADGGAQALALHLGQYVDESGSDTSVGPVYFKSVDDPGKQLNAFQRTLLGKTVAQLIVHFAADYEHVFATSGLLGTGTPDWLVPSALEYVYTDGGQGGGAVAIVAATYRRGADQLAELQAAVDENLVTGAGNAAIAVSGGLFIRYVLGPLLPAAFDVAGSAPSFGYDGVARQMVSMGSVPGGKVHYGLSDYEPQMDSIRVGLAGEILQTQITGTCDMGWGVGLNYTVSLQHRAAFHADTGSLVMVSAGPPASSHGVTGAGTMVPGIAEIIALIVNGIAEWIGSAVTDKLTSSLGNMTILQVPPLSVEWTGVSNFKITTAGLDDGLWMRGTVA